MFDTYTLLVTPLYNADVGRSGRRKTARYWMRGFVSHTYSANNEKDVDTPNENFQVDTEFALPYSWMFAIKISRVSLTPEWQSVCRKGLLYLQLVCMKLSQKILKPHVLWFDSILIWNIVFWLQKFCEQLFTQKLFLILTSSCDKVVQMLEHEKSITTNLFMLRCFSATCFGSCIMLTRYWSKTIM